MDRVAAIAAGACAVHCMFAPVVLPILPLIAGRLVGPGLEWGFTGISMTLGIASLGHSYLALHRSRVPLIWFCVGFALLIAAKFVDALAIELSTVAAGASCIMFAHILNLRMRRQFKAGGGCGCPCHEVDLERSQSPLDDQLSPR
jgi:hypothetical protein